MTCRSLGSRSGLLPEMPPVRPVAKGGTREAVSTLMDVFETQSEMGGRYCTFLHHVV